MSVMLVSRRNILLGSLALPVLADKKPPASKPNIVLLAVDGLPAWVLGAYGNKEIQTPNLDRFAQTGTRFQNNFTCAPAAGPGRACLLTGRTPMQLGDAETPSVAVLDPMFSGQGYATHTGEISSATQFLDQQTAAKPFLITAGFAGLQAPYPGVAAKFQALYTTTKFDSLDLQKTAAANARAGKEMLSDTVANVRKYAAAVSALDADVGALLAKLAQRQLVDGTLVIFTSSYGALLGRHGLWDAGEGSDPVNMYDEAVHTPLLMSWAGRIPAQGMRPEMVSSYDLVPTLAELAGTSPAANMCGRSYVLPATSKPLPKKQPWRTTVFARYRNTEMARVERYKLVLRDQGKGPGELYDLKLDPAEKSNQYDNQQFLTVRTSLAGSLAAWRSRYST
jgi:arylsulfatase A-like enzyme